MSGPPGEFELRRYQVAIVGSKTPMVDTGFAVGGGGGGGGGGGEMEPPPPPVAVVIPTVPSTVPTASAIVSLNVMEPVVFAARVPTVLACPRLNVPPSRRRFFGSITEPAFSVTKAACRSTVAP